MELKKQAVVLIHGIGEQRPMETLRGFVRSLLMVKNQEKEAKFWSKPDKMSELLELRRLKTMGVQPKTSFYEYYWAHYMEGTKLIHILRWLWRLLYRWPWNIPDKLVWIWSSVWLFLIAFAGLVATRAIPLTLNIELGN